MAASSLNRSTRSPSSVQQSVISASANTSRWSLVNLKVVMAITGAGLLIFVTVHMLGNLQIYFGQESLNSYATKLKSMPLLLWTARLGLIALFSLHLVTAILLQRQNRRARPHRYVINDPVETTLASRTMLSSGLVIFAFLIYHLLHFTLGITDPEAHGLLDSAGRHDVFSMVVLGFRNVYVSTAYIVTMLFLGLHLSHASSSIFQTLGLSTSASRRTLHRAGVGVALIIMLGNISIPLAISLGLIGLPLEGVTP